MGELYLNRQIKTNEIYATDEEGKVNVWYRKYMLDGQNTYHQAMNSSEENNNRSVQVFYLKEVLSSQP